MPEAPPLRLTVDAASYLKGLEEGEADALFALIDADRAYLREWLPWVDGTKTVNDSRAFILATQIHADHHKSLTFGLWVRERLVGVAGTHLIDWPNRSLTLGYWIGSAYQGRGHVTAACRALVRYAFDHLQIHRVEIRCAEGNAKSRAIPERLGFRHEGVARDGEWVNNRCVDLHVYALLAPEWTDAS